MMGHGMGGPHGFGGPGPMGPRPMGFGFFPRRRYSLLGVGLTALFGSMLGTRMANSQSYQTESSSSNYSLYTYCPYCGTKRNSGDSYCSGCGASLKH